MTPVTVGHWLLDKMLHHSNSDTEVALQPLTIGSAGDVTILGDLTISGDDLIMGTNTSGHIMVADGTSYNPVAVSGDVTLSAAGAFTIAAQAVENSMLADDAVGADELAANAVVEASIVDNSVTLAKMAGLARGKIILGDASGDPSALAVGGAHRFFQSDGTDAAWVAKSGDVTLNAGVATIGAGRVVNAMLANDAVGADELAANAVVNDSVAAGAAIAYSKMEAVTGGQIMVGNGSNVGTLVAVSGDATMSNAGALTIAAAAVEGSMLNANVISGQTDIGGAIALTDELMISDNGVLRRTDMSRLAAAQAGAGTCRY